MSYTSWKRESDKQADHTGFQPKSTPIPVDINQNQNQCGSAWNRAGTWEERYITKKQIEDFFNDYIKTNNKIYKDAFKFDKFSDYSGDVSNRVI